MDEVVIQFQGRELRILQERIRLSQKEHSSTLQIDIPLDTGIVTLFCPDTQPEGEGTRRG